MGKYHSFDKDLEIHVYDHMRMQHGQCVQVWQASIPYKIHSMYMFNTLYAMKNVDVLYGSKSSDVVQI